MSEDTKGVELEVEEVEEVVEVVDVVENAMELLKKSLAPLSEEETKAIVAALAPCDTPPLPSNEVDGMCVMGSLINEADNMFLADSPLNDTVSTTNESKDDFVNISETNKFADLLFSKVEEKEEGGYIVSAANDTYSLNNAFSTFESNYLNSLIDEHSPTVEVSENNGKKYFLFDKKANRTNILVIVFEVAGKKMVNINDVVFSLDLLFTLDKCIRVKNQNMPKKSMTLDLRDQLLNYFHHDSIKCVFKGGETLQINGIDTILFMTIVSHLSSVYLTGAEENAGHTLPTAVLQQAASSLAELVKEQLLTSLTGAFICGIGVLIGKHL